MRLVRPLSLLSSLALVVAACSDTPTANRTPAAPRGAGSCTNTIASVTISGQTVNYPGYTSHLNLFAYDANNCAVSLNGHNVSWTSSTPSVAAIQSPTVYGTDWVAGALGSSTITVNADGKIASVQVSVIAPPHLASLTITPNPARTSYNSNAYFVAQGKDQYGNDFSATVTWSSSNTSVATINSSTGVALGTGVGTTTITATAGTVTATAPFEVTPAAGIWAPEYVYEGDFTVRPEAEPTGTYHYSLYEDVCTNGEPCTGYQLIGQGTSVSIVRTMSRFDSWRRYRVDVRNYAGGPIVTVAVRDVIGGDEPNPDGSCWPAAVC